MLKNELRLRERAYRNGWLRERKLHMIWRAIARRHLSCLRAASPALSAKATLDRWADTLEAGCWATSRLRAADNDGESDP
jgi:hypothetical protein